jgi:Tol biopolymer transport system component
VAAGGATAAGPYRNGLIAFTRCCGLPETGIYVIGPGGCCEHQVFSPKADDAPLQPAWSPDGTRIAYVPGLPVGGLWAMRANGSQRHRVTAGKGDPLAPTWSSDGKRIAFADLGAGPRGFHDLYVVRAGGKGLKRLTSAAADELHPAWAPNGRAIAYERGRDLWRMQADGTRQRLLLRNASSPSWSPGGSHLAFIRGGDPWVAARDGTGAKRVTKTPRADIDVAWSPDGRWLVTAPIDRGDLLLVRADGSSTRRLTKAEDAFNGRPSWQRLPVRKR